MNELRSAVRSLRASRTFTTAVVVTLALGIGATSAIFSLVDAVLLRPLPYSDAERVVTVGTFDPVLIAVVGAAVLVTAAAASLAPAQRATRVDPAIVLRAE